MKSKALLIFLFITVASCDPLDSIIEKNPNEDNAIYYTANNVLQEPITSDTLKIVSWNIKFGGGRIDFFFDCYGDRVLMTEEEVLENLEGIVDKINNMNPDIIFLQEIDIDSKRSAYIDELQYILDNTGLNYGFYGSQWKSDYITSDGIGRVNSGNAILSKYALSNAQRIPLSLFDEQSSIIKYFYLRRNLLKAEVSIAGETFIALTTHTAAYSTDGTKLKQLKEIKSEVDSLSTVGMSFILGGDFNTIPPNSILFQDFDDDKCAEENDLDGFSYENELTHMQPFFDDYKAAITQDTYDLNNSKYYSYTSDKDGFWNRKLDYIFTNGDFVSNSGLVHQNQNSGGIATMPLSDHAPISVLYIF